MPHIQFTQITTVYNRDSLNNGTLPHFDQSATPSPNKPLNDSRHTISASSANDEASNNWRLRATSSASSPSKKKNNNNSLTLSSFTSIFRKNKSASAEMESAYEQRNGEIPNLAPSASIPDRGMLGCLPHLSHHHEEYSDINSSIISAPDSVLHMTSVHFNDYLGRYEGLPAEWKVQNRVFGVPMSTLPKRMDPTDEYPEPIPTVLLLLKEHLIRLNAVSVVGIFRLAPDKDECNQVKNLINVGEYDYHDCQDPNILANLLKVFFRDLPDNLFNTIPEREILKIASLKTIEEIEMEMITGVLSKPSCTVIMWLLDFMAMFVQNEHVNKMSAKNMAIVVSPNLYAVNSENPMVALTMAQKVAEFTTKILAGRLKMKFSFDAGIK